MVLRHFDTDLRGLVRLFGCEKEMKSKLIYKNTFGFNWPRLWIGDANFDIEIAFTDSCRYEVAAADQADWCKVGGVGYGLLPVRRNGKWVPAHHNNSARWAWRYNPVTDLIELAPYMYWDGVRYAEQPVYYAKIGDRVRLSYRDFGENCGFGVESEMEVYEKPKTARFGYEIGLKFGGNLKAPHKIEIYYARR